MPTDSCAPWAKKNKINHRPTDHKSNELPKGREMKFLYFLCHLFDRTSTSDSEVWGFGNSEVIERVQLKFMKYILQLKNSTPNYIVYGELE